jgi:putative phosphoesterase
VTRAITIGLISDTHGLVRREAVEALAGVARILHAGDIGGPEVLEQLRSIAPVEAVRGNNDKGDWTVPLPPVLAIELAGVNIHMLHDLKELEIDPTAAGIDVVVSGHSHKPNASERDGVWFVNPGSAGPRRFTLPVTVGFLDIRPGTGGRPQRIEARILEIV